MVGFYQIDIYMKRKFKNNFHYYISILFLITVVYKMFIYHPFQNIYFNNYFSKISHLNFEIDYWGLSGKKFLEEILVLENENVPIKIGIASFLPLERSVKLLNTKDREKIIELPLNKDDKANFDLSIKAVKELFSSAVKIDKDLVK